MLQSLGSGCCQAWPPPYLPSSLFGGVQQDKSGRILCVPRTSGVGIHQVLGVGCRTPLPPLPSSPSASQSSARCSRCIIYCGSYRSGGHVLRPRKTMHPEIYEVTDEDTGEKVIVWGVEGEDPKLTQEDLRWEPAKVMLPGESIKETWDGCLEAPITTQSTSPQDQNSRGKSQDENHSKVGSNPNWKARDILDELRNKGFDINKTEESTPLNSEASNHEVQNNIMSMKTSSRTKKVQRVREREASNTFDPNLTDGYFSIRSFKDLGAHTQIIQALLSMQINRPSEIQALAYKTVLERKSCILADQTGSGKTLAYLAPLVQRLKEDEHKGICISTEKSPCIVILTPTSELAVQIFNVCRSFSKGGCPFKSMVATGGFKWKTQIESLMTGPNIVVATPGRFLHHLEAGNLLLNNLKSVVLDEVDILFEDEDFSKVMQKVGETCPAEVQYVHVTATLPLDLYDNLLKEYPNSIPILGPSLHRTTAGLQEVLVDCSGESDIKSPETAFLNKRAALLQLMDQSPVAKTIIFCNKIETCRKVENVLKRFDRSGRKISVLPYHAAVTQEVRFQNLQQFLHSEPDKSFFLVSTDRASRGLDSVNVEHIILFDFPRDPSEYVRRVGRTARGAGGTGKVFVFVVGKQVGLARRIMARNEKGHPVHSVPGYSY